MAIVAGRAGIRNSDHDGVTLGADNLNLLVAVLAYGVHVSIETRSVATVK